MPTLAPVGSISASRLRHVTRTQLTVIRGHAQLAHRRLGDGAPDALLPDEQLAVQRAVVAIEQASRALEAWIEVGLRDRSDEPT